jgi:hypothetical protein
MAKTTISPTTLPGSSYGVGFQDFVFTPADVVNGNQFLSTGKELLLMHNVNADSPPLSHKVTLFKTQGKMEYNLAGGAYDCCGQIPTAGWKQTDTYVYVTADSAEIELAVLVLP